MIGLFAPAILLTACWSMTLAVTALTLALPDTFDLVTLFMHRELLEIEAFGLLGGLWLAVAMLVFVVSDLAAQTTLPPQRNFRSGVSSARLARLTFLLNLVLIAITLIWVAISAAKLGSIGRLVNLAYADSLGARALLLENKLFVGMRLFYAALPATGCLAAAILAWGGLSAQDRRLCWSVLILNSAALLILPIVMSQRLLLLQFLLSSYIVACLVKGRLFGLRWLALAALLFLATWTLRESVTNPTLNRSAIDLGLQKLAYYFVNDTWNGFAPLQDEIRHTFGAISLRGLLFLLGLEGMVAETLADRLTLLDKVRGGGDFPIFTAFFVDFGLTGGALAIWICGFSFRLLFHKARQSLGWAALYAQLGAALMFSSHGIYFTHQNFLFSLILMAALLRLCRRPRRRERLSLPSIPYSMRAASLPSRLNAPDQEALEHA